MEYLIAAMIPVVAVAIVVIFAKRIASHTFKCRHCSKRFRIKWTKAIVAEHFENDYMLVCPYCKIKIGVLNNP